MAVVCSLSCKQGSQLMPIPNLTLHWEPTQLTSNIYRFSVSTVHCQKIINNPACEQTKA